jgi:hypothetical protein
MDDALMNAQQQKENQDRFQDLCNSDLVDKAATIAAAAMLAADLENEKATTLAAAAIVATEKEKQQQQHTNIFHSPERHVLPVIAEATEEIYLPSREEREAFGNRARRSPSYYAAPSRIDRTFTAPEETEEEDEEEEEHHPTAKVVELSSPKLVVTPIPESAYGISAKDITELKEETRSQPQWDTGSAYEDEEQLNKVCYLIKIEELREEGIPMYKAVDIDSDLSAIKLCHAFMNERGNRRALLRNGKGAVKFTADIFGKVSDFFQKNEGDNDSTDWRNDFKANVESGLHDIPIRKVMNKYENFHPPEEISILQLMYDSKTKFDDKRKKQQKMEQEQALKGHEQKLDGWENYLSSLKLQEKE